mmetsp:Transcript_115841/g.182227  ORF Transcript_115841/g.182227 Transcript_115841/m.182227 type:complete len:208 (-) Transcript_115841:1136-1759(-)
MVSERRRCGCRLLFIIVLILLRIRITCESWTLQYRSFRARTILEGISDPNRKDFTVRFCNNFLKEIAAGRGISDQNCLNRVSVSIAVKEARRQGMQSCVRWVSVEKLYQQRLLLRFFCMNWWLSHDITDKVLIGKMRSRLRCREECTFNRTLPARNKVCPILPKQWRNILQKYCVGIHPKTAIVVKNDRSNQIWFQVWHLVTLVALL